MRMVIVCIVGMCLLGAVSSRRVSISSGSFVPLYGVSETEQTVFVDAFEIDAMPDTNREFLLFIKDNSTWRPTAVPGVLAEGKFLKHWNLYEGEVAPVQSELEMPVVNVSWFAASDYCRWRGGRLPTLFEWEYVASASDKKRDASRDPEFVQELLAWYSAPQRGSALRVVGNSKPNIWGVYDLHGVIWEWVADFNSIFIAGDNRRDGEQLKNLFCGDSAASSSDRANYAAFMRYALRNSLRGEYTMENLGFRCAYN